jgi:ketosteroid isomerase-like protein
VRGRAAIVAVFKQFLAMGKITEADFTTDEVAVDGNVAYESGSNMVTVDGPTPLTFRGRYVTIWRRQPDGSWQVFRDIGNTPKP